MIVTQTPLRVSLCGGGTDFPDFYRDHGGCVLSTAIDKYVYVVVKRRFDSKIRVGYTRTEMVDSVDEVQHDLVREALRIVGVERGVEIATMADIPARGSGLGSSASVTVGVLHALYAYTGQLVTAERLAEEACRIEIDVLGRPVGKQDQYIAAYGGLRFIEFRKDGSVSVAPVALSPSEQRRLESSLMLFFTGITRDAQTILAEQKQSTAQNTAHLQAIAALAREMYEHVCRGQFDEVGRLLHENWEHKRRLASRITLPEIDEMYERARQAGALGGKIAGAGGGGFLLLYCRPEDQERVREALRGFRELPFRIEPDGSKVVFNLKREE